jgi:hypothetical protein
MFDSVENGVVPICVLSILLGASSALLLRRRGGGVVAFVGPMVLAYAWFWLPRLTCLFDAHPSGESLHPWDVIVATYWSIFAVPSSVAAFTAATFLSKRRGG